MTNTERLYTFSDNVRIELAALDRQTADAKEDCRRAIVHLTKVSRIRDSDGRCFTSILEAIDDLVSDTRNEIRARIDAADRAIEDAEHGGR